MVVAIKTVRLRPSLFLLLIALFSMSVAGCGGDGSEQSATSAPIFEDPGPIHVHGLDVNTKDGALFAATHSGLFRAGSGERSSVRVAGRYQDTMGFAVVGPDHFLGSGHPDGREDLPPFLGLIESRDAGETWTPVSLLGKRDFHILEAAGTRIYGFGTDWETRLEGLLVSDDGGRSWSGRPPPEPLISLAIDPDNSDRILAAGTKRLYMSVDAARSWRTVVGPPALLSWPRSGSLFAVSAAGTILRTPDPAANWRRVGTVAGEPAAFEAQTGSELHVALHDGTIKRSTDGGATWVVRAHP